MYERGLYGTRANGWGLKRFGVENDIYAPERIRNPQYMPYLEAMEQVTDSALQQMPTKERMKLMKSRTAFIYADSWGESGPFEKFPVRCISPLLIRFPRIYLKVFDNGTDLQDSRRKTGIRSGAAYGAGLSRLGCIR